MRGRGHAGLWLLIAAAGFFPAQAARAAADDEPVQAEFFADASAVAAGQPFKVGVLFRIAPEWHIYWKYPGDAGLATEVTFELPKGFAAGELQWPLPQSFVQPGDVAGYGYTGSVMLTAEVTPPKDLPAGEEFAIRAKVVVAQLPRHLPAGPRGAEREARRRGAGARRPTRRSSESGPRGCRGRRRTWTAAGRLRSVAATAETLPSSRRHENRDPDCVGGRSRRRSSSSRRRRRPCSRTSRP